MSRRQVGQTSPLDRTHVELKTVAKRNAYSVGLRVWGMLITVTDDPTPANNVTWELKKGLASNNKRDNGNWQIFQSGSGGGETTPKTATFAGDGATLVFAIVDTEDITIQSVYAGGQLLREGTHYTKNDAAKTVSFILPAVPSGVGIDVKYFAGISVGSPGGGTQDLASVLTQGNSASAQQIKGLADPTLAQDADTLAARNSAITAAINGLLDSVPTAGNTLAKLYTLIQTVVGIAAPQAYDAGAAGGAMPSTFSGQPIKDGQSFRITNAANGVSLGATNPKVVRNEDLLISLVDNPTNNGNDWTVVEGNKEPATELILGLMKIATQVLTNAGQNDTDAVTPLKLKQKLKDSRDVLGAAFSIDTNDDQKTILSNPTAPVNGTVNAGTAKDQVFIVNQGTATISLVNGAGVTGAAGNAVTPGQAVFVYYLTSTTVLVISGVRVQWPDILLKPTNIEGYGITNGVSILDKSSAIVGNAGAVETDLVSYVVPGGTLGINEQSIRTTAVINTAANANAKRIRAYFATLSIFDSTSLAALNAATTFAIEVWLLRRTATTVEATFRIVSDSTVLVTKTVTGELDLAPLTTDLSANQTLRITGTGVANNDLTRRGYKIFKEGI